MIDKENLPKAYKECIEILKYIPKNEFDMIPNYIIENMNKEMDVNYNYQITHFSDFENQEMLEETKAILAVLFRDYWATEKERAEIKARERYDIHLLETEKRKKYKRENLFKVSNVESKEKDIESNQLIEYKKNIFSKLKENVLKLFHIK